MENSRTLNTSRNIIAGFINRLVSILLPFINRTIIIYVLGAEFSGLDSLFMSILAVLSIAELGFHTAIVYSMYGPIAEGNNQRICELLTLYRKIYYIVGAAILGIGIILFPMLPQLIHGEVPTSIDLYWAFGLYLTNSVISYFMFSYKESLLIANQRQDISQFIRTIMIALQNVLQIGILLLFRNYYLYLTVTILCTILTNIGIELETNKYYPECKCIKGKKVRMPLEMRKQVGGLFICSLCDKARNSFDSIILSVLLGLTVVAIYNNYFYIYMALYGIILMVCNSMGASVGNCIATESKEKNYQDLQRFSLLAAWLTGWFSICMLCLYQPFMQLWVGKDLMLDNWDMMLFCLYFYVINMNNVRNQYSAGSGIWWEMRYAFLLETVANCVLNLVLGKLFGVTGILVATIITIFFFNFLWRTVLLFRIYFDNQGLRQFLLHNLEWFLAVLAAAGITYGICALLPLTPLGQLIGNGVVCLLVPNVVLYVLLRKTETFQPARDTVGHVLGHFIKR